MNDFDLLLLLVFGGSWQLKLLLGGMVAAMLFGPALHLGGWLYDLGRRLR